MLSLTLLFLLGGSIFLSACGSADRPDAAAAPTEEIVSKPLTPDPSQATPTIAANPDLDFAQVMFVKAIQGRDGLWEFDVTVRHNDEGWKHYADAWQVVDPAGQVVAERVLLHPHDTEQPFTRSQNNIKIPVTVTQVIVRAKCNLHGFGGQEIVVDLTATQGENFEVIRL